jgi:hypothetical protein
MKKSLIGLLLISWCVAMLCGFKLALDYDMKASAQESSSPKWPGSSSMARSPDRWTLVMAMHPQCPCTRASINELERVLAKCGNKLEVQLLLYRPAGTSSAWAKTPLADQSSSIQSIHSVDDPNGVLSTLFGATTSGEILLYDPSGNLRFHGGITGSRGHEGDNDGEDSVVGLVNGQVSGFRKAAYFGCLIHRI